MFVPKPANAVTVVDAWIPVATAIAADVGSKDGRPKHDERAVSSNDAPEPDA